MGIGVVAGLMSGLFGVGGGILIVPALTLLARMPQRRAHGTSLAAVLPIAVCGMVSFAVSGSVDWPVAVAIGAGAVVGAQLGARALKVLPTTWLRLIFIGFLLASAVRLFMSDVVPDARSDLSVGLVSALVLLGVLSGALAGLLGVGGGIIMVPAMVVLVGLDPALAKGTSLAVMIPTSISGTWRNVRNENALLPMAVAVGLAGTVTSVIGAQLSVRMDDRLSNVLFAGLLLVVAVRMVTELRRGDED